MPKAQRLEPGIRYGRLVSTGRYDLRRRADGRNRAHHEWRCDCGTTVWALLSNVRNGNTKSCGCLHRDTVSAGVVAPDASPTKIVISRFRNGRWETFERARNHGESKTALYGRWKAIVRRCTSPRDPKYRFYGGRGINVCDEWSDYLAFKAWALGSGYQEHLELDRIDPDDDYRPENCRWIDKRTNIQRARRGLGRLGLPDDLELRLRERAAVENLTVPELLTNALECYLSRPETSCRPCAEGR